MFSQNLTVSETMAVLSLCAPRWTSPTQTCLISVCRNYEELMRTTSWRYEIYFRLTQVSRE